MVWIGLAAPDEKEKPNDATLFDLLTHGPDAAYASASW